MNSNATKSKGVDLRPYWEMWEREALTHSASCVDATIRIGLMDSHKGEVTSAKDLSWLELGALMSNVETGNKIGSAWLPARIPCGPRRGEYIQSVTALVLDIEGPTEAACNENGQQLMDEHGNALKRPKGIQAPDFEYLKQEIQWHEWDFILHTTHSHSEAMPRYRLILRLSRELKPEEVKPVMRQVAWTLNITHCADTAAMEPARLFFLPRVTEDKKHLSRFHQKTAGKALLVESILEQAEKIQYAMAEKSAKSAQNEAQGISTIQQFNAANQPGSILESCGYMPQGDSRWLYPGSTSGLPGVRLLHTLNGTPVVYSSHTDDPLNDGHIHDAFDCLKILRFGGDLNSALRHINPSASKQSCAPLIVTTPMEELDALPLQEVDLDMPAHLLDPPGILGSINNWILGCAQKPQPVLALVASLSAVATALAQKVAGHTGLRTNLYLVGVADTSAGKDHGRRCIKKLFEFGGMSSYLGGEEVASGPALLTAASRNPCTLFQFDEFGLMLQGIANPKAGPFQKQILSSLIKLFSSASSVYTGAEYSNQRERPRFDIAYPCINIHGTSTPEALFASFGSADVASGYLNRLLIVFAENKRSNFRQLDIADPPEDIVRWVTAARNAESGLIGVTPDTPFVIPATAKAQALFEDLYESLQDQEPAKKATNMHHLWGRYLEHALKISIVVACAKAINPDELANRLAAGQVVVDEVTAQWAIDFVTFVLNRMENEVLQRVADTEFGQILKAVEASILKADKKGLSERELGRKCARYKNLPPQQRDAVTLALQRDGEIKSFTFPPTGRGKGKTAWVHRTFWKLLSNDVDDDQ